MWNETNAAVNFCCYIYYIKVVVPAAFPRTHAIFSDWYRQVIANSIWKLKHHSSNQRWIQGFEKGVKASTSSSY